MKAYRQGDVVLKEITKVPKAKKVQESVLAYGEVTGHKHQLQGKYELYREAAKLYLRVLGMCILQHEEHETIEIPEGDYEVINQQEYDWVEKNLRPVVD